MEMRSPYFDDPILALVRKREGKRSLRSDSEKENGPALKRPRFNACDENSSCEPSLAGAKDAAVSEFTSPTVDDSRVPDTQHCVTREDVLAAAGRYSWKRPAPSDSSDTDSDYNYLLGPSSKRRKKDNPKYRKKKSLESKQLKSSINSKDTPQGVRDTSSFVKSPRGSSTSPSCTQSTTSIICSDGRTMMSAVKPASKSQKILQGYPLPTESYPRDFTLSELCSQYPNHLFGTNLHPFLQHKWSPNRIILSMPSQDHLFERDRVTVNAIASRLKKVKVGLERTGAYDELMAARREHVEDRVVGTEVRKGDSSEQSGKEKDAGPGPVALVEHGAAYAGIFDHFKHVRDEDGFEKLGQRSFDHARAVNRA